MGRMLYKRWQQVTAGSQLYTDRRPHMQIFGGGKAGRGRLPRIRLESVRLRQETVSYSRVKRRDYYQY